MSMNSTVNLSKSLYGIRARPNDDLMIKLGTVLSSTIITVNLSVFNKINQMPSLSSIHSSIQAL